MNPTQQKRVDEISRAPIALTPVESSQITAIGHDERTNTLAIRFHGKGDEPGPLYHYSNFTAEQFDDMRGAKSIGSYFYANVKNPEAHPYAKIVEQADEQQAAA
jgi:hypothetical protein